MAMAQAVRLWRRQQGVSSIEYALLGALIAVVCTAVITNLGGVTLNLLFLRVCTGVALAIGNPPC